MSPAGNLDSFPRSANVKLILEFEDTAGGAHYTVGSGSMRNAGVIVTAGHCLYYHGTWGPGGPLIDDYATRVWALPGWDGVDPPDDNTPPSDEDISHWGWVEGAFYVVAAQYVNSQSGPHDIGALRITRGLSRNVGMITGWYGMTWDLSCSTVQSLTYHNFSYPSEAPCHTGRTMMYWNGTFDHCNHLLHGNCNIIDTGGNCMDSFWGGMSGSGVYYLISGERYLNPPHPPAHQGTRSPNMDRHGKPDHGL